MTALRDVREGLEARLDTISGLRRADSQISPPAYVVTLQSQGLQYHRTFQDGLADWPMRVIVYVSTAYTRTARDQLDDFCDVTGSKSVKQAIEGDRTLGGVVDDLMVRSVSQEDFAVRESGTIQQYLGADFTIDVQGP